jgi:hypothetical protein
MVNESVEDHGPNRKERCYLPEQPAVKIGRECVSGRVASQEISVAQSGRMDGEGVVLVQFHDSLRPFLPALKKELPGFRCWRSCACGLSNPSSNRFGD